MNRDLNEAMDKTLTRFVKSIEKKSQKGKPKVKYVKPKDGSKAAGISAEKVSGQACKVELDGITVETGSLLNDGFQTGMTVSFDEHRFRVVVNAPVTTSLSTYPKKTCYVGSPVVPSVENMHAEYTKFLWYCERPNEGYVFISNSTYFVPTTNEVGCRLKVYATPCRRDEDGGEITGRSVTLYLPQPVCMVDQLPEIGKHRIEFNSRTRSSKALPCIDMSMDVPTMLGYSFGTRANNHEPGTINSKDDPVDSLTASIQSGMSMQGDEVGRGERGDGELRVISYNILADTYATQESTFDYIYPYIDPKYLQSEHRMQLVLHELLLYDADVLCMQECDAKVYYDFFEPIYKDLGYVGIYTNKDSGVREGCAMFIRKEALTVVQNEDISLKETLRHAPHLESIYELRPDLRDVLGGKLGTIAQLCVCRDNRNDGNMVIISNTHLFYHPRADYVRALQTDVICQSIERLKRDLQGANNGSNSNNNDSHCDNDAGRNAGVVATILCGDLNSCPQSAATEYLKTYV